VPLCRLISALELFLHGDVSFQVSRLFGSSLVTAAMPGWFSSTVNLGELAASISNRMQIEMSEGRIKLKLRFWLGLDFGIHENS